MGALPTKRCHRRPAETKRCPICMLPKPVVEFGVRKNGYLRAYCKSCDNDRYRQWCKTHPEAVKQAQRKTDLRLRHGISETLYQRLSEEQGGGCALCGRPPKKNRRLSVDHDHETDEIRGLLCDAHNRALGLFQDNVELLYKAIAYLKKKHLIVRDLPQSRCTR
jgi:hypothetical protein